MMKTCHQRTHAIGTNIRMLLLLGIVILCIGVNGCGDDDDDPTTPTSPLDLRGTYRIDATGTPVSGNCSEVPLANSGTATLAQSRHDRFTVDACETDLGIVCDPAASVGTIDGQQVTLQGKAILPNGGEGQVSLAGTVTDPSSFTLFGQATVELPCVVDLIVTFTKM